MTAGPPEDAARDARRPEDAAQDARPPDDPPERTTNPAPADRPHPHRRTFAADFRDAVSLRTTLLVIGVFALQLGFIGSYLGAFHHPTPHRIPIAVVVPAAAAQQLTARLDHLPGDPLRAKPAPDEATARRWIDERKVYGAFVLGPGTTDRLLVASAASSAASQALIQVAQSVETAQHRNVAVTDVKPAAAGDGRGLSSFYVAVGWVVGGYLVASLLAVSAGARPANRNRALIRLGTLALYAVASGLGGAVIVETVLKALSGHFFSLWAFGALVVFGVGAVTMAFQVFAGTVGIALAILFFVILGNPSAGGPYPGPLLPPFWRVIGPWLAPGAGTYGIRSIVYFTGHGLAGPALVLAGYAVVGTAATVLGSGVRRRPIGPRPA